MTLLTTNHCPGPCGAREGTVRRCPGVVLAILAICAGMVVGGCGLLPRHPAVPPSKTQLALIDGRSDLRFWPALGFESLIQAAIESNERERKDIAADGYPGRLPAASYLAISGGGDSGAFGAGLLVGWTKHGDRPAFKAVTGVSAGALIAPFAFLGSAYDGVLHDVAVSIGPNDVFHSRSVIRAIFSDAVADDRPLAALIEKYVTPAILTAIAKEYSRGRALFIGTTDLDSGLSVVWDMGAIASLHDGAALKLFRQIMLASASIPGIFPPVMIDASVGHVSYQEMHVDGGAVTQVFLFPRFFIRGITADRRDNERDRDAYIIRNGRIEPVWQSVRRRTASVGRRAIEELIDAAGVNDLYRLEDDARVENEKFHVAYIGDDFNSPRKSMFDSAYLRHLFQYAYDQAASGTAWHVSLPGDPLPATTRDQTTTHN
jgi:hypothetical protein